MPYSTPGRIKYAVNGSSVLTHGQPVINNNVVGAAIKQRAVAFDASVADQNKIAASEEFAILAKGIVEFDTSTGAPANGIASASVGDAVYIVTADNTLTATSSGNTKFGRVHEVTGAHSRGVGANRIRIDLDARDSI